MGIRNWAHNRRPMSKPVAGVYQLTSCSFNDGQAVWENCSMHGVVTAPGLEATAVAHSCLAPTKRWPQPGQALPVTVDLMDPTLLKIEWKQLPTGAQQGQMQAEAAAAAARAQAEPGSSAGIDDQLTTLAGLSPDMQKIVQSFTTAQQGGARVTVRTTVRGVVGDEQRPQPGESGGGLSPVETAQAATDGGAALGLVPATATLLAVHDVDIPPGTPGAPPAGAADLTLDVSLPAAAGYTTTMRLAFRSPARRAVICAIGRSLPVLVDPAARDRILIDTSRMEALPD